jgi:hypothetical protein
VESLERNNKFFEDLCVWGAFLFCVYIPQKRLYILSRTTLMNNISSHFGYEYVGIEVGFCSHTHIERTEYYAHL